MKTDCLSGIQPFLLEKEFKRRGYMFYRIRDDIAQLVSFDKVSFIILHVLHNAAVYSE